MNVGEQLKRAQSEVVSIDRSGLVPSRRFRDHTGAIVFESRYGNDFRYVKMNRWTGPPRTQEEKTFGLLKDNLKAILVDFNARFGR